MFGLLQQGINGLTLPDAESTRVIKNNLQDPGNDRILLLSAKYRDVFQQGFGSCTKMKIPIFLKANSKPCFFKLHVEEELE